MDTKSRCFFRLFPIHPNGAYIFPSIHYIMHVLVLVQCDRVIGLCSPRSMLMRQARACDVPLASARISDGATYNWDFTDHAKYLIDIIFSTGFMARSHVCHNVAHHNSLLKQTVQSKPLRSTFAIRTPQPRLLVHGLVATNTISAITRLPNCPRPYPRPQTFRLSLFPSCCRCWPFPRPFSF